MFGVCDFKIALNILLSRIISVTFVNTEKSRLCLPLGTYKESTTAFPVDHLPGSAKCLSQSFNVYPLMFWPFIQSHS